MSEKIPQPNSLEATDSSKKKITKAATLGVAAFALLAGEACSPDKGSDMEQTGSRDKQIEMQKEFMSPNPVLLAEYRKSIHTGNFPAEGQKERTTARALEIVILKGMSVNKGSKVEVEARGTVPVQIKIDGRIVPVGPDDYTTEELDLVRLVQGVSASMGNTPDKNDGAYLESEERISPMAGKIFNGRNKPEKRKSKSDF